MANVVPVLLSALFGLSCFGFGAGLLREMKVEGRLARRGFAVPGWVVRREDDGDGDTVPVVRFSTRDQQASHEFAARGGVRRVRLLPVGTIVTVRYLPESPDVARIDTTSELRAGTLGFAVAFCISASLAALTLWWALARWT